MKGFRSSMHVIFIRHFLKSAPEQFSLCPSVWDTGSSSIINTILQFLRSSNSLLWGQTGHLSSWVSWALVLCQPGVIGECWGWQGSRRKAPSLGKVVWAPRQRKAGVPTQVRRSHFRPAGKLRGSSGKFLKAFWGNPEDSLQLSGAASLQLLR